MNVILGKSRQVGRSYMTSAFFEYQMKILNFEKVSIRKRKLRKIFNI
jgi:hypothetical protein